MSVNEQSSNPPSLQELLALAEQVRQGLVQWDQQEIYWPKTSDMSQLFRLEEALRQSGVLARGLENEWRPLMQTAEVA